MKKIFCIGFNKTGTTSIADAFKSIGYKSFHKPTWVKQANEKNKEFIDKFDIFSDGNGNADVEWLNTNYDALFILNWRDVKTWCVSRWNHARANQNRRGPDFVKRMLAQGRLPFVYNDTKTVIQWIKDRNMHHQRFLDYFEGKDNFMLLNVISEPNKKVQQKLGGLVTSKKPLHYKPQNVKKRNPKYNPNPREVNEALKAFDIKPRDYDKLILDL
jgi:hypothetical protein